MTFTADIHSDLKRRDFTVNAMAYHPTRGLIDDCGGREDIKRRQIRCVGEPTARFREDALRIMRGLRFSAVLGFGIEPRTASALRENKTLLQSIAAERIREELVKLLCGQDAKRVLLEERAVLAEVIPELRPMFDFDQKNPHHHLDVWVHTVEAIAMSAPLPTVRLALLFHDIGKPASFQLDENGVGHFYGHPAVSEQMTAAILRRLRFDRDTIEQVCCLVRWHNSEILPEGKSVKRWLNRLGEDGLRMLLPVKRADRSATNYKEEDLSALALVEQKLETILREAQCFTREQLAVGGKDLLALGVPEGRQIGALLELLLNLVMDEKLPNQRAELLAYAKQIAEKR